MADAEAAVEVESIDAVEYIIVEYIIFQHSWKKYIIAPVFSGNLGPNRDIEQEAQIN